MARRGKQKMLTAVPGTFDPNFIDRMSGRYVLTRVVRERREALEAHVGGQPSYVQQSLIKRALWLELITESYEQKFAEGGTTDVGAISQLNNSLKGLYRDLGIARTARPVRTLRDVMRGDSPSAAA